MELELGLEERERTNSHSTSVPHYNVHVLYSVITRDMTHHNMLICV